MGAAAGAVVDRAAVAAVDDRTAVAALGLIELELQELPAYYSADAALTEGAVDLHDKRPALVPLGDAGAQFADAVDVLVKDRGAFVFDGETFAGLITRIDLLNHLRQRMK